MTDSTPELGVPTGSNQQRDPRQDAGQDPSIVERLERDPESDDARLDNALDETMDASDPVEIAPSGRGQNPAPSSGYDEEVERRRAMRG